MTRIIVNIAGGQTQPNILFSKEQFRNQGPVDKMIVIHTEFSERQFQWTQEACKNLEAQFIPIQVVEDDIIAIQTKLTELVTIEDEDEILVNITGGTKLMAIAVYDHFVKYSARIFYVTLGKNTYTQILPRIKNKISKFQYSLSLEEYLTGYGVSIVNKKKLHSLSKPPEITENLYRKAINFTPEDWEHLDYIRTGFEEPHGLRGKRIIRGEGKNETEIWLRERTFEFLEKIEFHSETKDVLSKKETKYLTGDWFEEYVYLQISDVLIDREETWGMGAQIEMENTDGEKINNELDLAIMLRNTLHIIECKTQMISTGGLNILASTLYKADSLKSKFGLRVPFFVFTLSSREEVKKGIPRSKLNEVTVVSRDELQNPTFIQKLLIPPSP